MSSLYTRLKITLGSANADDEALAALQPGAGVAVQTGKDIVFAPTDRTADTGLIWYPGGRCDPRAYAPVLRELAMAGYLAIVPCMPLRLAVLDSKRAGRIIAARPSISRWLIGGHSMGGAMAAAFVHSNRDSAAGLFFTASYPAAMHAMPDFPRPVTMIYGTHDAVTRKSEFEASYERLPAHTRFVAIEGGDHYQFGSFGNVEVSATISRSTQHRETVATLIDTLNSLA